MYWGRTHSHCLMKQLIKPLIIFFSDDKRVRKNLNDKLNSCNTLWYSKGHEVFICTMKNTKEMLKANSNKSKKGEVVVSVRGVMNSHSVGTLPKNSQQISYTSKH